MIKDNEINKKDFNKMSNQDRGIAISITGGFLIYELLLLIIILVGNFNRKIFKKNPEAVRFVQIYINEFEIDAFKSDKNISKLTLFSSNLNSLYDISEDSILKNSLPCVEFLIYIIIFTHSNKLIGIDKTLIFLVLIIMSLKACLKYFIEENKLFLYLKITGYDIFCLITYAIIFILSSYVKLVRDILVNLILSVFYSIILSLFISTIYYEKDDLFNRFKQLLKDDNKENFSPSGKKIRIEFIFMGCFILYLITIFLTWRLFWKKKTIVKMNY
ncbi:hypothetical protein A0H76_394 [Hepatospora eriocheir]|uniref:Uncharacterized protein n=1 Tax=Hepatospora eriocheir TaxID=1081669 RepID=A0A1X0QIS9_9MICR|nr:hypothetical protein A0H76_394 [Hepatospora eriocheir]